MKWFKGSGFQKCVDYTKKVNTIKPQNQPGLRSIVVTSQGMRSEEKANWEKW